MQARSQMVRMDLDDSPRLNNNLKPQHLQLGLSCLIQTYSHLLFLISRTSLIENAANELIEVFPDPILMPCIKKYKSAR